MPLPKSKTATDEMDDCIWIVKFSSGGWRAVTPKEMQSLEGYYQTAELGRYDPSLSVWVRDLQLRIEALERDVELLKGGKRL